MPLRVSIPSDLPESAEVLIEISRGSRTKYTAAGDVDFVSPLGSPFNYGSVEGTLAPDGDPMDALVLGPRVERGERVRLPVLGVVYFADAGLVDHKWIVGLPPLRLRDRVRVVAFFRCYALAKTWLNRLRHKSGPTGYYGLYIRGDEMENG